jgi:hypothetical protein
MTESECPGRRPDDPELAGMIADGECFGQTGYYVHAIGIELTGHGAHLLYRRPTMVSPLSHL